jgi:hypothetical protein
MKMKNVCALGAVCAVTSAANAAFLGLVVDPGYVGAGWVANGYAGLTTCRVYAEFDNPADFLISGSGSPGNPLWATSTNGAFYAPLVGDGLTAPMDLTPGGIWMNQWDTYVTIGLDTATGDATGVSPGFAAAVANLTANFSTTNAAWFVTPADPQGTAGNYPGNMVLMAQFTVADTNGPTMGGWGVQWNDAQGVTTLTYAEFECIPAPGVLALLGLAGLVGRRRR